MVYGIAAIAHLRSYPPVSIASFMLMENISNLFLFRGIFICDFQEFKMVIDRTQSEPSALTSEASQGDIPTLVRRWLLPIEQCPGFLFLD